jgi:GTP:adenosylcobinamide-phosphate guanylyltransferase
MDAPPATFRAVVLAGERPGGSALSRAAGVEAGVLVPVAGIAAVERVLDALDASPRVDDCLLCGPDPAIAGASDVIRRLTSRDRVGWLAPADGPAASALAGLASLNSYPMLVTAGDHALLSPAILEEFLAGVEGRTEDAIVGLVPYEAVRTAFPESRRTVLKFSDGGYCGSNLFAFLRAEGLGAVRFWRQVESDRKRPWRVARRLGLWTLLRYLAGRCTVAEAFRMLSEKSGCAVDFVRIENPAAAVDVDSVEDWRLAERILRTRPEV